MINKPNFLYSNEEIVEFAKNGNKKLLKEKIYRNRLLEEAQALEAFIFKEARSNLAKFARAIDNSYILSWAHIAIYAEVEKVLSGETKNLIIMCPPRLGKSQAVCINTPAYFFGKYPNKKVILATYGRELTNAMSVQLQKTMMCPEYFKIFPETKLGDLQFGKRTELQKNKFDITNKRGQFFGTSIGGALTGRGGDLLIVDDPFKDSVEANSIDHRNKVFDWYKKVLSTRGNKDFDTGKQVGKILVMTRWHEDDLAGRLIEESRIGKEKWEVLSLPLLKKEDPEFPNIYDSRKAGESVWPERWSSDDVKKARDVYGTLTFECLFQQSPVLESGNIIKSSDLRYYSPSELDQHEIESYVIVCDLGHKKEDLKKKRDYTVIECWARMLNKIYLIKQTRKRGMSFREQLSSISDMVKMFPTAGIKIEAAGAGEAIVQILEEKFLGVESVSPTKSKEIRLRSVSHIYSANNVYYPEQNSSPWIVENIKEILGFPNSKNDDTVDTATMAIAHLSVNELDGNYKSIYEW